MQGRPHGDQRGRAIADGATIGNIAADGGRVADLHTGIAAQHFGKRRMGRGHCLQKRLDRNACPNADAIALMVDALQIGQLTQKGGFRQIAQLLGHPKPHICRPGDQRGVGVGGIPIGERIKVARAEMFGGRLTPVRQGYLSREDGGIGLHPFRHRSRLGRLGGADDRGIAGAAAKITCQHRVMVGAAIHVAHGHRHAKPRCAKAALAAMMVHHGRLNRVRLTCGAGKPFDGADRLAIKLRQKQDTGVQRL